MGLDCSHDAFHGAYSAFNRFRQAVAKAMGGSYPPHEDSRRDATQWYWGDDCSEATHPGLFIFFNHSDCDGEITPEDCVKVANDLETLLPNLPDGGEGHILRDGGYRAVCKKFIEGCRAAAAENEPLHFG